MHCATRAARINTDQNISGLKNRLPMSTFDIFNEEKATLISKQMPKTIIKKTQGKIENRRTYKHIRETL
uniref:Uncharacterized protein n=1 Tax=Papilio xuthus TaxID=66420 RepID=I4DQJ3_PAPXU|nr:unknown unsecreted protein [Papilio xuthus]